MNEIVSYVQSPAFIGSIIVLALYLFANHLVSSAYKRLRKEKIIRPDQRISQISHMIYRLIQGSLVVIMVMTILHINGIRLTTLAAFLSVLSAVVGLAMQDLLRDIVNGIHLSQDNYFDVGDTIVFHDITGKVTAMSARSVRIDDIYTHDMHIIANRNIDNVTRKSRQNDIDIGLSYEDDPEHINLTLQETCVHIAEVEGISECIYKGVHEFRDSCIIYKIRFFCAPDQMPDLRREALRIIQRDLHQAGIVIPYPQLDMHAKN